MYKLATIIAFAFICLPTNADDDSKPFDIEPVATFNEAWAMTFLPDGRMLVTEKRGQLLVVAQDGEKSRPIGNVPDVDYRGQGGLGDVILHPKFKKNNIIYLSYAESGAGNTRGAAVARAELKFDNRERGYLSNVDVIWRQNPKVTGGGHYGHRMAFDDKGYLFISSGDRQKFDPAQHMTGNLGKIVRLNDDGSLPDDNPFAERGDVAAQIWSLGHRNPLGIAFDANGQLWNSEMGPLHGDELNKVMPAKNYGYPHVSNGKHYNGDPIPDHDTRPEFEAPAVYWIPSIAPGSLMFYSGKEFPAWRGSAFIAGLGSRAVIRVTFDGDSAQEAERFAFDKRIRDVVQGPDGALWVLEDNDGGRLLKLTKR